MGCWAIGGPDSNLGLPMGWSTADDAASRRGLEVAYELGARLFDTADVYGHGHSERLVGLLVEQVARGDLVLVSKVGYFAGTAPHGFAPGHIRRQLAQTLENLRTDYLDVYFLHHSDFGPRDQWLHGAVETMRSFKAEGLIRAVGMRGPHRFATDRLASAPNAWSDKAARFRAVFDAVRPDVLAVRDNLLTPASRSEGIFAVAARHQVGVLVNKPLAQGLLTGAYQPGRTRVFGPGDHRSRKRWFTPDAVAVIDEGLDRLRGLVGTDPKELVRLALWACLVRYEHSAVLVGFTAPEQVRANLTPLRDPPDPAVLQQSREIMAAVQARLDAAGEVFLDQAAAPRGTTS
jgi:aryl-alcohol dehydrogenase-like predicted oxidoreductase